MSRFGADYHVARSTGRCTATGEALEPGRACVATLCERPEDEGFDRKDFSLQAWEAGARPEGLFSFWKTIVPNPDAKPRMLVDDAVLMDLFERLATDERPQRIAFRFVLALILLRKKQLKFVGRERKDGVEWWLVTPRGATGQVGAAGERGEPSAPIAVIDPHLADDDVRELMDQLSEVLQSDL